jgi:hypothetical protein
MSVAAKIAVDHGSSNTIGLEYQVTRTRSRSIGATPAYEVSPDDGSSPCSAVVADPPEAPGHGADLRQRGPGLAAVGRDRSVREGVDAAVAERRHRQAGQRLDRELAVDHVEARIAQVAAVERRHHREQVPGLAVIVGPRDPQRAVRAEDLAQRGAVDQIGRAAEHREIGVLVVLADPRAAIGDRGIEAVDDDVIVRQKVAAATTAAARRHTAKHEPAPHRARICHGRGARGTEPAIRP